MAHLLLTGDDEPELINITLGVNEYGTGFGGKENRILGGYTTCLFGTHTLALNHPEVGLVHGVVETKLITAILRAQVVTRRLTVHDGGESLAIGHEADFIHMFVCDMRKQRLNHVLYNYQNLV